MTGVRSAAIGIWIGVGSRFEVPAQAGVSHFLEHLLFKGTPTRSAKAIAEHFDGLGGSVNAGTGRDYTVLYTRVLDSHVNAAFDVLADMAVRPIYADLDQERQVVIEEIAMYEDEPDEIVSDLASEAVFPDQPLGRPVIGYGDVIERISRAEISAFHQSHYTATNIVVAAAGAIGHNQVEELAARMLADLPASPGHRRTEPAVAGPPTTRIREKSTEQVHLCLTGPGLDRDDPRRFAHAVLDTLLGGSMSSRLFQEIREKRGLSYSVGSYTVGYSDAGQVAVYLGTREDNLDTACMVLGTELRRLADEIVPEEEIRRTKEHLKGRLVLGSESPNNRMNRVGRSVLQGSELWSIDQWIAAVESVEAEEVRELARAFWQPESLSAAAVGPNGAAIERALATFQPERSVA